MKYKVSVIIPTYNSAEFLDSTIKSVMNQTIGFENIELILVDDYSTDSTMDKINSYCSEYENIKTYESGKKTGTPGRARNIGIEHSQSDYIMFLDHDDRYVEDAVETLYNAITTNEGEIAIGKFRHFGESNIVADDWIDNDFILNSISENIKLFSINNIWRMIFPKELLIKNNITFPEGVFAEDLTFMVHSFIKSSKTIFINKVVYDFRLRTGSGSSTSLSKGMHYLNGLIEGYDYTYDVLKETNSCQYYEPIFNQHLSSWLNDLVLSETIKAEDKYELIKKSQHLYAPIKTISPIPENDDLKAIAEKIKANEINDAFKMMYQYKYTKQIDILEKELNFRLDQVAHLQSTGGWVKYKIRNILDRLKNKI